MSETSAAPVQDPRANPLARGPLECRADLQRAVRDLYDPLVAHMTAGGARVRLGSFGTRFEPRVAELEGFARPLFGIVPLTIGGGRFDHWDRIVAGLDAGSNPDSDEYWGPIGRAGDQRMVEQAAIGLALAFCPDRAWEPLSAKARDRLATWLRAIFDFDMPPNNWHLFRVLVSLGLERVGVPFDRGKLTDSLQKLESYRRGRYWYADGASGNVDYYVPSVFHAYGLMYAAANRLGLGDDSQAEAFRERAAGFAVDFQHWFAPDGAAIPFGRSMTYRFAMGAFWAMLAWADVEPLGLSWGEVRGLAMRNVRWWARWPISDRDGVLSVGFTYDNRNLAESYSSVGSTYWCMTAFGSLAAPPDHPFWASAEAPQPVPSGPVHLPDAGWVTARDNNHATALVAHLGCCPADDKDLQRPNYNKLAWSSAFGFSADRPDVFAKLATDSTLALTTIEGHRQVHAVTSGGIDDAMAWYVWRPWDDVRVDTVCWLVDASWHGRLHRVRTRRPLESIATGFAIGHQLTPPGLVANVAHLSDDQIVLVSQYGCSAIVARGGPHQAHLQTADVNANLIVPYTAMPALRAELPAGDHVLAALVYGNPQATSLPTDIPDVDPAARALLDRTSLRFPPDRPSQ